MSNMNTNRSTGTTPDGNQTLDTSNEKYADGNSSGRTGPEAGSPAAERRPLAVLIVTAVDAERDAVLRGIARAAAELTKSASHAAAERTTTAASTVAGTAGSADNSIASKDESLSGSSPPSSDMSQAGGPMASNDAVQVGGVANGLTTLATEPVAEQAYRREDGEDDSVGNGGSDGTSVRFEVITAGVGPAYAAASTASALARRDYDLVVSAGIGGGFPGIAPIGTIVLADAIVAADLGAETADGQLTLDELGFGTSRAPADAEWGNRMARALASAGLEAARGPILTVSLATGRAATAQLRQNLVPGAAAEGMEGYGVAVAAAQFGVACAELRAISNAVGPRDRSAWRIGDALRALEDAFHVISLSWGTEAFAQDGGS